MIPKSCCRSLLGQTLCSINHQPNLISEPWKDGLHISVKKLVAKGANLSEIMAMDWMNMAWSLAAGQHFSVAEDGFDPSTSGLWAQHASAAPLCSQFLLLCRAPAICEFKSISYPSAPWEYTLNQVDLQKRGPHWQTIPW